MRANAHIKIRPSRSDTEPTPSRSDKKAHTASCAAVSSSMRPAIASVTLSGNKAIKDEELYRVLNDIGLSEGEVFDRLVLDRLSQELVNQYFNQGRYAVEVDTRVTDLDRNRVRIAIVIDEGKVAEIRHINIVGNETFTDEDIQEDFEADIPPFWKFWSKDGQYSREKLSGDIEKLRSYYLDRGYVDFSVESTQVSITPDLKDIYITVNITEGDQYRIREVRMSGDFVVPPEELFSLVEINPGERAKLLRVKEDKLLLMRFEPPSGMT